MNNSEPLAGDPNRRANDAARGYIYQFWITVRTWVNLEPDQFLYVEGAEDIDLFENSNEALAIQVRDVSYDISLGNAKIITVLNNFWKLKKDNPEIDIQFQYISTAKVGKEKGQEICGVEVWEECQKFDCPDLKDKLDYVKKLLLKHADLDDRLRYFLNNHDTASIKKELIDPFQWVYKQVDIEDIKRLTRSKILKVGESSGIDIKQAENLSRILYEAVEKAAISESPAKLTYFDFRQYLQTEIDNSVNTVIPRKFLQDITAPETLKALKALRENSEQQKFSVDNTIDTELQTEAILFLDSSGQGKEDKRKSKKALKSYSQGNPVLTSEYIGGKITSLESELNDSEQKIEDQKKKLAHLYLMQASILLHSDHKAARDAYRNVIKFYPEHIHAWNRIGWLSIALGELDDAEIAIKKAASFAGASRHWQAVTWGDLGLIYFRRGNYKLALDCQNKALSINKEIGREIGVLACQGNIANIMDYIVGDDKKGQKIVLDMFHNILNGYKELQKKGHDTVYEIGTTYSNLCRIYTHLKKIEDAKEYYELSWNFNKKHHFTENMARDLSNRAHIFLLEGDRPNAINCLEKSLEIEQSISHKYGQACDKASLAGLYRDTGNPKKANELFVEAMALFHEAGADEMVQRVKRDIIRLNYKPY